MSRRLVSIFLVALLLLTPFAGGGRGATDDSKQTPFDSPLGETNEEADEDSEDGLGSKLLVAETLLQPASQQSRLQNLSDAALDSVVLKRNGFSRAPPVVRC